MSHALIPWRGLAFRVCGLLLAVVGAGCQSAPAPGMSRADIQVAAKPKAGVKESFPHVAIYDAAPAKAVAKGRFEHVDYSHLSDVIVWLMPAASQTQSTQLPARHVHIDPAHPDISVGAASVGQMLMLHNYSSQPISLYSVSDGNDFDLPSIAPGASGQYVVRSEGLIEILSDPAKPPVAQLYAAPSPWVARTEAGKTVSFDNLPPGQYAAIAWHPRLPGSQTNVSLAADHVGAATLTLGVNALRVE